MKLYALNTVLKTIPFWIVVLVVLQIIFSNQLVKSSQKVEELDRNRHLLEEENEILDQQLAALTSIQNIEFSAKNLGLVNASKVISIIPKSFPVALQTAK